MREFLKGLDLDRETINTIMAEHGKLITEAKEKIREYEDQISELKGSGSDSKKIQEELDNLKKSVAEKEENEKLTNDIMAVIGNKKFASDYAKNGLIADVKAELGKEENKGKEMKDIVASLTKDKSGIFANPQQPNMAGMSNKVYDNVNKEAFNKMGYQERVSFKQENPELFAQLNSEE